MKLKLPVIFLILTISYANAQTLNSAQLDSLYNLYVKIRIPSSGVHQGIQSIDTSKIKCATSVVNSIKFNIEQFQGQQKKVLLGLLQRPSSDTSIVSPNGFFRIHFTKSNFPDYVPDQIRNSLTPSQLEAYKKLYLDSLAMALDSAYSFEVDSLKFPPPPSDDTSGGDSKYDIYLSNLGNTYGYTEADFETPAGSNKWSSYMTIDNDFVNFFTTRIYAARVTVAHEFHHSIQIGNYVYRYDTDEFFYELTSTSMEHFVYPSIHDYFQYLPFYFGNSQNSFTQNGTNQEYALAIWNIYLKDRFGFGIIKNQWELMPNYKGAIQAIAAGIANYNSSFGDEFAKFGIWTFYTNYRSIAGKYFEDGHDYPVMKPVNTLDFSSSSLQINGSSEPLTNSFITVINPSKLDSLGVIITNSDVQNGFNNNSASFPFVYNLSTQPFSGSTKLTDNYYYSFSSQQPGFWLNSEILNNQVVDSAAGGLINSDYAFPSPFSYKKNYAVTMPVQPNPSGYANLNVYSVSMRLVYSANKQIAYRNGQKVLIWNALDDNNGKLATGVYIYVIKSGDNVTKGKLVILNE